MSIQKIESAIHEKLTGDTQKNALDFVAFLHANKIPPKLYVISVVGDGGNFPHIRPWVIFFNVCEYEGLTEENLLEFAWKHTHICDRFITGGARCGCGKPTGYFQNCFWQGV